MQVNRNIVGLQKSNKSIFVTLLSLILVIYAARMQFVFDIGFLYVIFISSLIIAVVVFTESNNTDQKSLIVLFAFAVFLWVVQSELIKYRQSPLEPYAPTSLASIFPSLLMGFVFVVYPINKRLLKITTYCILIYFFISVVIIRDPNFLANISEKTSDVGILNLTLALIIPVMYLEYRDERKITILPLLMQLVISLFLESRIGLGSCALLFSLVLLIGVHRIKHIALKFAAYFVLGGIAIVAIVILMANVASFAGVQKTLDQGTDLTGRTIIWANYFNDFSLKDLIFGRDIIGINEGDWQNAHNSWIQLHSAVGLIGVIIMIVYIRILVYNIKHDLLLATIMFVMLFFSFFNKVYFFSTFDWCVYIFYFDFLRKRELRIKDNTPLKMALV